jgi:hypothetical protein
MGNIKSRRADSNRLPLLQLRVMHQALEGFAWSCNSRISKPLSFPWFAVCCTVLRSRWCQSGVRSSWITRRGFLCNPDPRLGYPRLARCAGRDEDGVPATGRVHARQSVSAGRGRHLPSAVLAICFKTLRDHSGSIGHQPRFRLRVGGCFVAVELCTGCRLHRKV